MQRTTFVRPIIWKIPLLSLISKALSLIGWGSAGMPIFGLLMVDGNSIGSPALDDRFHETGLDEASTHGTRSMLVDSSFEKS